jgi:hypothetical protein
VEGRFVGYAENSNPRLEKQNAETTIPIASNIGFSGDIPTTSPMITGTVDIAIPNNMDATASPKTIVFISTGHEINLSKVLICPSHGAIAGETDVDEKNTVIDTSPAIRKFIDSDLPMQNAKNRKSGRSTPKMTTGPLV